MTWVTTAVVGASVVNAIASDRASGRATEASQEASQEQLEFEKQRYEEWKEVYGDIQTNLSEYYSNLTPEYYEVQGLEAFEKEKARTLETLQQNLAQRGITGSGYLRRRRQQSHRPVRNRICSVAAGCGTFSCSWQE